MSGAEEVHDAEGDLIVVANRLPVEPPSTDTADRPDAPWRRAPGGLVSALDSVLRSRPCTWVGYGQEGRPMRRDGIALEPLSVDEDLYADYYTGFCNSAIWPLYHDAIETPDFHRHQFDAYLAVNRIFAEHVAESAGPGARVWVHDYQLQLVPDMIRRLRPDVRIGFFLHIPFPPPELFAQLPWRRQVLEGLLGSDLIGFQTPGDTHNFLAACTRFIGAHAEGGKVVLPDRDVTVEAFPVGVDARGFSEVADRADVRQRASELRAELGNPQTLMLGVDRLDYTKGIDIRLRAFAELMERGGLDHSGTVFVQVAVPTRGEIREYQRARTEVEALVGRINGSLASIGAPAIQYLHRMLDYDELVALYLAADILVVTPLRDGMNLVAKEYVATRNDGSGALILSEFAGAAQQLSASWLVNPYDTIGLEDAMAEAATSSDAERHGRMVALRRSVFEEDVEAWARGFLEALAPETVEERDTHPPGTDLPVPVTALATTPHLLVCCDYDGTLAPIVEDPTQARPLEESVVALRALSVLPSTTVAVVSGRSLRDLAVRSRLPSEIHLVGSHGWEMDQDFTLDPQQRRLLHQVVNAAVDIAADVPGADLELKPSRVAGHVRRGTPAPGGGRLRSRAVGAGAV
ncbi:MAG: trehalose-6-phosphate synthase, partial [bacterium]